MIIDFQFKGDRNYVHGTDMFNKYLASKKGVKSLSLQIKKMTDKNLEITTNPKGRSVVAEFRVNEQYQQTGKDYFVETDKRTTGRYDYDEDELVSAAQIEREKKSIWMRCDDTHTFIENVVALHKKLVINVISDQVKWLFVGLDITEIPNINHSDKLAINIAKNLGTKLVQSKIVLNEKEIGTIKFSSIKKG